MKKQPTEGRLAHFFNIIVLNNVLLLTIILFIRWNICHIAFQR